MRPPRPRLAAGAVRYERRAGYRRCLESPLWLGLCDEWRWSTRFVDFQRLTRRECRRRMANKAVYDDHCHLLVRGQQITADVVVQRRRRVASARCRAGEVADTVKKTDVSGVSL